MSSTMLNPFLLVLFLVLPPSPTSHSIFIQTTSSVDYISVTIPSISTIKMIPTSCTISSHSAVISSSPLSLPRSKIRIYFDKPNLSSITLKSTKTRDVLITIKMKNLTKERCN